MPYTKDDVARFRSVNGVAVALMDAERQAMADEWNANETAEAVTRAAREAAAKRAAALKVLEEKSLAEAMLDPNAPQAVKDYAAALVNLETSPT